MNRESAGIGEVQGAAVHIREPGTQQDAADDVREPVDAGQKPGQDHEHREDTDRPPFAQKQSLRLRRRSESCIRAVGITHSTSMVVEEG